MKAEIEGLGRQALLLTTDVTEVADIPAMISATQEAFGRLDILVNNADWTSTTLALDVQKRSTTVPWPPP